MLSWDVRYAMGPDGLSYVDMALQTAKEGPRWLINGYWSPVYPAALSAAYAVLRPSPLNEFPVAHLITFLVFALALAGFSFLLKSFLAVRESTEEERAFIIPFGFAVFLWFSTCYIGMWETSPDMGVAAMAFFAAGMVFRLMRANASIKDYVSFGVVLGCGYWMKAVFFALSMLLLGFLFLWPPARGRRVAVIVSGIVCLIVAAPLIVMTSIHVGKPTIGETGKLNYVWHDNGMQPIHEGWTEPSELNGTPVHPPRVIFDKPRTIEFSSPIPGTYPLWYEPSYWYLGAKVHFIPKEQLVGLKANMATYWDEYVELSALIAGAFVLWVMGLRGKVLAAIEPRIRWFFLWPMAAYVMYALIHVEHRYTAGFHVLFWLAVYTLLWKVVTTPVRMAVTAVALCAIFIPRVAHLGSATVRSAVEIVHPKKPYYAVQGDGLAAAGIHRGDRLASVGTSFDAYYAQYLGTPVSIEITDLDAIAQMNSADFARLKARLVENGVKALIAFNRPITPGGTADGWQRLNIPNGEPFYFVKL